MILAELSSGAEVGTYGGAAGLAALAWMLVTAMLKREKRSDQTIDKLHEKYDGAIKEIHAAAAAERLNLTAQFAAERGEMRRDYIAERTEDRKQHDEDRGVRHKYGNVIQALDGKVDRLGDKIDGLIAKGR